MYVQQHFKNKQMLSVLYYVCERQTIVNSHIVTIQKFKYTFVVAVILDSSGFSKGYGFVRFGSEDEQKDSLTTMNGYIGLGTKALKICNAVPKPKGALTSPSTTSSTSTTATYTTATTDYSQYYDPSAYWQNYTSWQTVCISKETS